MRFADPHACPSCGGAIAGDTRCPQCRLDLNSPASRQLWQTLVRADSLLEEARRVSWTASAPVATAPMPVPGPPAPAPHVPKARRWSTGSIILALGALCLVVAAIVFITVSWDVLGPTGRTLVLLVLTAAIAFAAAWSTRARLRASAEALWAIFFGFFATDFFAARAYGLVGLDSLGGAQAALLFGIVAAVLGGAVVIASRPTLAVVTPSLAAGLAVWTAAVSLGASLDASFFWRGFAALALAATATAIARRLSLALIAWIAGAAVAVLYVVAAGGAVGEIAESPHLAELTRDGHGGPMLLMIALTAVVGAASSRATIPAATLVTLGAASLAFAPAEAAAPHEGGFVAGSVLAVALAFALLRGANGWVRGMRIGAAAILVALTAASAGWMDNALAAVGESNGGGFGSSWTARLANSEALPAPGWVAFVAFGAIATGAVAVLRWPEIRVFARPASPLPPFIAGLGLALGVIAYEPPVLLAALLVLALGLGALVLVRADSASGDREFWLAAAILVTAVPAVMTLASRPVTLLVWLAVAATLAVVAWISLPAWARMAGSFGAAALAIGAAALGADTASFGDLGTQVAALVVCGLVLSLASFALRDFVGRPEAEAAAGLGIVVTLMAGVDTTVASQALAWMVAGVVLLVPGLLVADRRWFRYPGSAALGVAWVLRLLASDVDTIEAYTAPFAAILLAAGLLAMRRNRQLRTAVALTPGLSLAFLPSIPQALDDPTGLRALLLGLAGLAALGIGIRQSLQVPVIYGSLVLALLVVWNVGPLANGLPRWILIAAAGVILVGSGITWESRVRNAKSAAQYLQNLR